MSKEKIQPPQKGNQDGPTITYGARSILVAWNTILDHLVPLPEWFRSGKDNIDHEKSGPVTVTEGINGKLVSYNTVLTDLVPLPDFFRQIIDDTDEGIEPEAKPDGDDNR